MIDGRLLWCWAWGAVSERGNSDISADRDYSADLIVVIRIQPQLSRRWPHLVHTAPGCWRLLRARSSPPPPSSLPLSNFLTRNLCKRISFPMLSFFFLFFSRSQPLSIFYKHACISLLNHNHIHRRMFTEPIFPRSRSRCHLKIMYHKICNFCCGFLFAFVCVCVCLCAETHSHTHTHTFLRLLNTRENTGVKQYLWRLFVNALSVLCYFLTIFFS